MSKDDVALRPCNNAAEEVAEQWNRRSLPQGEPEGWRPIETAPKDGRSILIAGRYANGVPYVEEGHRTFKGSYAARTLEPPTHWQPLPSGPTALQSGDAPKGGSRG